MKLYQKLFLTFIFLSFLQYSFSQKMRYSNLHLNADYHYGFLLPEYNLFNYLTNDAIRGVEINLTKDLKGDKLWERVYHYPSVGLSFYYGSLGNDSVFGRLSTVYPYIYFPLIQKNHFQLSYKLGVGPSYVTKKFDLETNYYNIAIASHFNIWFRSALDFKYQISNVFSVSTGTAFGHFSNANLAEPNLGLNFWTFYAGADVNISKQTEKNKDIIPGFKKKNEFAFIVACGGKHTRRFAPKSYFAGSLSGEYRRILAYKGALGLGADVFYDASIPDEMKLAGISDVKNIYKVKTGFHTSQELIVGKLSLIIQEGFYVGFTDHLNHHKMYNRGIIRYKFSDHLFVNMAMKTNLWILDVAELGVGYYFSKI